jgi:hypothetical protein
MPRYIVVTVSHYESDEDLDAAQATMEAVHDRYEEKTTVFVAENKAEQPEAASV